MIRWRACRLGHHLVVLSGHPAQLGPPISIHGKTPRAPPDDEELLHTQGHLMRVLTEAGARNEPTLRSHGTAVGHPGGDWSPCVVARHRSQ